MVLPDFRKLAVGTAFILGASGTHSPGATAKNNLGAITDEIALASVANDAARQGDKFNFGADRSALFAVSAAIEFAATPTAGKTVEFWLAYSNSATAGQGNPANVGGTDSAYTGYNSNVDESKVQMERIGILVVTADITPTIQVGTGIGFFIPKFQYATLVVVNKSGAAFHSDNVEMSVALEPVEEKAID
jgi:hypothetical protein